MQPHNFKRHFNRSTAKKCQFQSCAWLKEWLSHQIRAWLNSGPCRLGAESCWLIVRTLLTCTDLRWCHAHGPTAQPLLTTNMYHCPHLLLSPRQHHRSVRVAPYLFPANNPGCQSPSGWRSGRGSTCLSPPSSVCGAPVHLRGDGTSDRSWSPKQLYVTYVSQSKTRFAVCHILIVNCSFAIWHGGLPRIWVAWKKVCWNKHLSQ